MPKNLPLTLIACVALTASLVGSSLQSYAADHDRTVWVRGTARSFIKHVPPGEIPPEGFPVLLAFHGGGMQGDGMRRITELNPVADARRFIVVYPNGINKHWNDGRLTLNDPQDDISFVSVLLDEIIRTERVDRRRIFATGISNGALFTQRLGCELSDRVAGIAPIAGTIPAAVIESCHPSEKVAVLQIGGTADPIMPYNGGRVADFGGRGEGGVVTSVRETANLWAKLNNCVGPEPPEALPSIASDDPTRIKRTDFTSCPPGGKVTLISIIGGGHVWPNGKQPYRPRVTGQPSRQMDTSAAVADFFLRLPPR